MKPNGFAQTNLNMCCFFVYKLEPLSSFQSLFLFSENYSIHVLTDLQQISATDANSIWKYLSYIGSALEKNWICMHQYKNFVKLGSARVYFFSWMN